MSSLCYREFTFVYAKLIYICLGFFLQSAQVDGSMKKILKILRNVLHETLVPGEQVVISTPKMIIQIEKNNAGQVANKTIDMGTAKIDLPNWCDMEPYPCDKSKTVMIQVRYTIYKTFTSNNLQYDTQYIKHCHLIIYSTINI